MITVVANLKGGTGKSTVAFNLAVFLASHGKKTRLFDLDPQRTLTDVVEIRNEEGYVPAIQVEHDVSALRRGRNPEILVDVGTSGMEDMRRALTVAERVLVPVPPSQADVWSTQRFIRLVDELHQGRKRPPNLLAFINRGDTHRAIRETDETEEALRQLPGIHVIETRLYQRTSYRRSFSEGLAVFELERNSKAAAEVERLATVLYSHSFIS